MKCTSRQTSMMYRMTAINTSRNANLFLTAAKSFFGSFAAAFSNLKHQHMINMHMLTQTPVHDLVAEITHLSLASQLSARMRSKILSSSKLQQNYTYETNPPRYVTMLSRLRKHTSSPPFEQLKGPCRAMVLPMLRPPCQDLATGRPCSSRTCTSASQVSKLNKTPVCAHTRPRLPAVQSACVCRARR